MQFAVEPPGLLALPFTPVIDGVFLPDTVQVCITFLIYQNGILIVLIDKHGVSMRKPSDFLLHI